MLAFVGVCGDAGSADWFGWEIFWGKIELSFLDTILQRNKEIAARQAGRLMPSLPGAMPNVKATIIGCADMRVDPVHLFGLQPGEAVVIRNIGGRVTPGLLEELGLLGRIGAVAK